jgi:hypothetical protein
MPIAPYDDPLGTKAELPGQNHHAQEMSTYSDSSYGRGEQVVSPLGSPVPTSEGTMASRSRVVSPVPAEELFLPTRRNINRPPSPIFEVQ